MKASILAVACGVVFVGVVVFRLAGRDSLPTASPTPVSELVSTTTPAPAAIEEEPAQPMASQEVVEVISPPLSEEEPSGGSPEDQTFLLKESVPGKPPVGWWGSIPDYATEIDHDTVHSGKGSVRISSVSDNPQQFGTAGQAIKAGPYRRKRVQLSASIKTENATGRAGLWFRVDATDRVLAFDNMMTRDRWLRGNTDWTGARLVLDVPDGASGLYYGLVMTGRGKAWMDDVRIEVVDEKSPLTQGPFLGSILKFPPRSDLISGPRNLDFEQ